MKGRKPGHVVLYFVPTMFTGRKCFHSVHLCEKQLMLGFNLISSAQLNDFERLYFNSKDYVLSRDIGNY